MYNKRGLSAVITTLLIVLLVLVAIGVVWGVIRNIIRAGSKEVSLGGLTLDLDIKDAYESNDNIIVRVERKVGEGDLVGIKFILSGEGDDVIIQKSTAMEELDQETFTLTPANSSAAQKVSVAPVYEKTGGEEGVGNVVDTHTIRRGGDDGGDGGDGGEETYCGDTFVQSPNDDGFYEECDSGVNCLEDCTCEFGLIPDGTNGCMLEEGIICDGTWDGNEQCDTPDTEDGCIDPGEEGECTCESGYDPDENGGCIAWTPINSGTVEEVWPPDTGMYFASDNLPKEGVDYTGYFVTYTDAIECSYIVNYVTPDISGYDKTHIAFSFSTDISVGDTYEIWGDMNRCTSSLGV